MFKDSDRQSTFINGFILPLMQPKFVRLMHLTPLIKNLHPVTYKPSVNQIDVSLIFPLALGVAPVIMSQDLSFHSLVPCILVLIQLET
jgi:hypothetical protein